MTRVRRTDVLDLCDDDVQAGYLVNMAGASVQAPSVGSSVCLRASRVPGKRPWFFATGAVESVIDRGKGWRVTLETGEALEVRPVDMGLV